MKPVWEDAPKWANYLTWTKGFSGIPLWQWHEEYPRLATSKDTWLSDGKHMIAYPAPRNHEGFEERPD